MTTQNDGEYLQSIKQYIWRDLKQIFNKYKEVMIQKISDQVSKLRIKSQNTVQTSQFLLNSTNKIFGQFEQELRKKLSPIIFKLSITKIETDRYRQIQQINQKQSEKIISNQRMQLDRLLVNKKQLQILLRTYERKLISKQFLTNHQNDKFSHINYQHKHQSNQPFKFQLSKLKQNKLLINSQTLNLQLKKQSNNQKSIKKNNLSSSRLTSSRTSKIFNEESHSRGGHALRQLQQNWNKSANLSSRNAKSSKKYQFYYQNSNQKSLNNSSVKQNIPRTLQSSSIKQSNVCYKNNTLQKQSFNQILGLINGDNYQASKNQESSISEFNVQNYQFLQN